MFPPSTTTAPYQLPPAPGVDVNVAEVIGGEFASEAYRTVTCVNRKTSQNSTCGDESRKTVITYKVLSSSW